VINIYTYEARLLAVSKKCPYISNILKIVFNSYGGEKEEEMQKEKMFSMEGG
tara:strand:+ start:70 stop:225 length:156 start_codon:yes stop_codon:yes gene_type:complete